MWIVWWTTYEFSWCDGWVEIDEEETFEDFDDAVNCAHCNGGRVSKV